ncbi:uncharacterized protein LOC111627221 [Centruroides sculpturatus]|uniref:uncharacterized protein LOC111627221 n=1 Tax=Centruroides sculpturatus TaxID=218467 RepID=UPI000C6DAEED|nr:uncharacterized protein LOC111627221 [Centruroides sculpturatus]
MVLVGLLAATIVMLLMLGANNYWSIKRRRENIGNSYEFYVDDLINTTGVGVIIFSKDGEIIWVSRFVDERFEKTLIGQDLNVLGEDFAEKLQSGKDKFRFEANALVYEAQVNAHNRTIVVKDVTTEQNLLRAYRDEKVVFGELEIDNYQQLQGVLPEDELYRVQTIVLKMLDQLVNRYNIIYRQYVHGKYILVCNESVLEEFKRQEFSFLDEVRNENVMNGVRLTISIGFGAGSAQQKELLELAKDGLLQAQSRGGDQVAVEYSNLKPRYFGAKTEIAAPSSRVKIKQITSMIEEKVRQASVRNVIIYGHIDADLDAIGAAFGVYELLKNIGKPIYIQNKIYDKTVEKVLDDFFERDELEIFITPARAQKLTSRGTVIFIVDTAEISRIENPRAFDKANLSNVYVIDHHRASQLPNEIPIENIYIDTFASSTSEIVTEMLIFSRYAVKPSKNSVQLMLNGIYLDTKQFQKSISSKTFDAASWLEKHGAQSQIASEILKIPSKYSMLVNAILSELREVKEGYFLAAYDGEVPDDIVSLAADEILRTQGRKAAFVIAKTPGKKVWKLSARGINTNVQTIAEQVGGGGHFGASAAQSTEPLNVFLDNVIQAIVSRKGDK